MPAELRSIAFAVGAVSSALGFAAPCAAEDAAWLAGDMVQVAAHRMDLTPFPTLSEHPLMGYLARPDEPGRHPAVIEMHGCGGFGTLDVAAADVLRSFGYAALALDSLGDYNACGKDPSDGALAEAFDADAALDWLAHQSCVDADRVAPLGFSMGGGAVLQAVEPGFAKMAANQVEDKKPRHFRAAIAFYPWCRDIVGLTTVPTLILVGDKDDWTHASWCRDMIARRNGKGSPVTLIVYPGATHAFNYPASPRQYLGHHLQYDPKATADAWRQVRSFLHDGLDEPEPAARTDHQKGN